MINGRYTLDEAATLLDGPPPDPRTRRRRRERLVRAVHRGHLRAVRERPGTHGLWLVAPADLDDYARRRRDGIAPHARALKPEDTLAPSGSS